MPFGWKGICSGVRAGCRTWRGPDTQFQFVTRCPQSFLRLLALGDIVHHPYGADDLAGFVPEMFTFFMDNAYLTTRPPDHPVFDFVTIPAFAYRTGIGGVNRGTVVGVDSFEKSFVGGSKFLRLQAEDTVYLIGPG